MKRCGAVAFGLLIVTTVVDVGYRMLGDKLERAVGEAMKVRGIVPVVVRGPTDLLEGIQVVSPDDR